MAKRRLVGPAKSEALRFPFEALIAVADRQLSHERLDHAAPNQSRKQLIGVRQTMRLVRRISRPEFVTAISAEHDLHMPRSESREDERRQDRGVRHRLVE